MNTSPFKNLSPCQRFCCPHLVEESTTQFSHVESEDITSRRSSVKKIYIRKKHMISMLHITLPYDVCLHLCLLGILRCQDLGIGLSGNQSSVQSAILDQWQGPNFRGKYGKSSSSLNPVGFPHGVG